MDLTRATVVTREPGKPAQVLVEEVEKRTGVRWPVVAQAPGSGAVVRLERGSGPAEGFSIATEGNTVTVRGNDARGVLFGVGRLLRALEMRRQSVTLSAPLNVTSAPETKLRGHQLGYRPKTNSYDAWDAADVGAVHPRPGGLRHQRHRADSAALGRRRRQPALPAAADRDDGRHVAICDDYGLDVWIWYPAMDKDYADPETVESALAEWGEVFKQLPRIDAVFVPGGDPGPTPPQAADGAARKAEGQPAQVPSEGADVGLAAGLLAGVAGGVLRHPEAGTGVADRHRLRPAGAGLASAPAPDWSRRAIRSATTPTSRTAGSASSRCRIGTSPSR